MTVQTAVSLEEHVARAAERVAAGRRGAVVVGAVRGDECAFGGAAPDTLFEIGSVTKTFTSLALAALAVRGQLALDRPLAGLLPAGTAVPVRGDRPIELGHLACHLSGLPALPPGLLPRTLRPPADPYAHCTQEVLLDALGRTRPRSAPGSRFRYSNLGAALLGLALTRHTGQDFAALIRAEITGPLGMAGTGTEPAAGSATRLAPGHSFTGRARPPWHTAAMSPAGGLYSTAPDLLTFALAQLGDAPERLRPAIALTHATAHPIGHGTTAHPGWFGMRTPRGRGGHRVLFHNGGTGGYRALLAVAPEPRAAVVVLSATARGVDRHGFALLDHLTRI
ncbi:serine hydrolase domain-containing protein [Streptomyces sp. MP131-18]|uniref:serine hydrolase domain-containing protein n=1 Tax=Streptomyces sp. MP131-18 TaxID=1857892 RepID=UPI00097BB2D6|nr:serine hydrolase domain-containing protein [Streptomyces sp. MP131-18]ONK10053.1 D-alanyl-D-alanine- carboxypeptidase/endopeptidase AmpH precursor [Streptomyces sp. MP131-18]